MPAALVPPTPTWSCKGGGPKEELDGGQKRLAATCPSGLKAGVLTRLARMLQLRLLDAKVFRAFGQAKWWFSPFSAQGEPCVLSAVDAQQPLAVFGGGGGSAHLPSHSWERIVTIGMGIELGAVSRGRGLEGWMDGCMRTCMDGWVDGLMGSSLLLARLGSPVAP